MLQVGLLGYFVADGSQTFLDSTPTYYEPGFNIFSPLEFNLGTCDQMYFAIRERRDESGREFRENVAADFTISTIDVTTQEIIPSTVMDYSDVSSYFSVTDENPPSLVILVRNSVDPNNPDRVRIVKTFLKNEENNNAVEFRMIIEDSKQIHYYIVVDVDKFEERSKLSMGAIEATINVNNISDTYCLFSPFVYFSETEKSYADFSYPSGSVFYKRRLTYNNEDYSFIIEGYSHTFVLDNISLSPVPNYQRAAVILVDKHMYEDMLTTSSRIYVDVGVTGNTSDIHDSFRVYFIQ